MSDAEAASYAFFFKCLDFADADIVIKSTGRPSRNMQRVLLYSSVQLQLKTLDTVLASFPGHRVILDKCPYFAAQARRWQDGDSSSKCTLEVTLDHEKQLPAAEAVIAALYHDAAALKQLTPAQLVHAVMLADRLQATCVARQAVNQLLQAAAAAAGTPSALAPILKELADLEIWPGLLLTVTPVVTQSWQAASDGSVLDELLQKVLVAAFGNLDDVWSNQQQQDILLKLPLPAMQLHLASDQLTVASEDTVYYTAVQYVSKQPQADRAAAVTALAPLIRCPQLSHFCLLNVALTTDTSLLLKQYNTQLRQLLSAGIEKRAKLTGLLDSYIPDTPGSWKLPARSPTVGVQLPVEGVSVTWQLPVEELKQACRSSSAAASDESLYSPSSPPLRGTAWQIQVVCDGKANTGTVGLYILRVDAPQGTYATFTYTLDVPQAAWQHLETAVGIENGWGWADFFELGPMSGGWDEAAWVANGLPISGGLELKLTVHSVGQIE